MLCVLSGRRALPSLTTPAPRVSAPCHLCCSSLTRRLNTIPPACSAFTPPTPVKLRKKCPPSLCYLSLLSDGKLGFMHLPRGSDGCLATLFSCVILSVSMCIFPSSLLLLSLLFMNCSSALFQVNVTLSWRVFMHALSLSLCCVCLERWLDLNAC